MKRRKLVLLIAPLGALIFAGSACQRAHRAAKLMPPPQAAPPALTSTSASIPPTQPAASSEEKEENKEVEVEPKSEPQSDPVADLIAKVEKEYEAGRANYQAGHLEPAKKNFDNAFNLLSSGPVEIRSDERLEREFEKLLEGVNGLPLTAVEEADAPTGQKSEPAPIDEANEVTFPVDPNIKAKAEAEVKATHSDLPLMLNDTVAGYINYFSTRGRDILERALERSGQYHDMIQRVLKNEGVPQDLIYLAQAESGFRPLALSRAGARGMWQFMSTRARGYGLTRNWWVDERQDPEKSTRAAARHLKDLYNEFGDWYLAMAAYNSGPGTVQNAVRRTGYADFWELYRRNVLPRETRNYVPIILAVTIMAKNPTQYGLEHVVPAKPVPTDTVNIDYPVDLRLVAQSVDASPSEVQDLNPSLLRMTTPKGQPFELHLPAGSRERYLSAIAVIPPDMRVWWRYHKVQQGDTLVSIARSYRTTAKAIASANKLDVSRLEPGSQLIIPIAPGKHGVMEDPATYTRRATAYKVRKGDTVASVADNFGVPPAMVRRWNRLKSNSLRGRRVVYVHLPVSPNSPAAQALAASKHKNRSTAAKTPAPVVRHKVKQGETLISIATSYKTTVSALQRDNGKLARLRPGMILIIRDIH
ncbi:MAG: lytic transglycosylase [Acidobacteria bacterium]|nr:MAG: lytic transglycosylase [Acidobacteriota bacterium]PYY10274.1 MAG: lytic transglycosylase [Acidobacteriota bacterium]